MAITEAYSGTASVSGTEFSCPNNTTYSSGSVIASTGVYQVFLDISDIGFGEELRIRIYEKCRSGDTVRIIYESYIPYAVSETWVSPSLVLMHGWDVTLLATTGSFNVNWSIRKVG